MSNLQQAEICLLAWGAWNRGNSSLGISGTSIIGRCIEEGAGASHSTLSTEAHMSRVVELTERCVLEMEKPLQRVCKYRYIGEELDEQAAKKLNLSVDIYQTRINQAVHFLADYLIENNY